MTRRHVTGLAPAAVLLGPWAYAGEPGHGTAGAVLLALAVIAYPAAALCSAAFPACLVTRRARAAWRHRTDRSERRSGRVPAWLRRAVLAADRGRCAARRLGGCERGPEADHVVPDAAGGLMTIRNLVTLCRACNRVKSDYWVSASGYVSYHPWPGYSDAALAARILAAERRARRNPLRYLRAALALR